MEGHHHHNGATDEHHTTTTTDVVDVVDPTNYQQQHVPTFSTEW